MRGTLVGQTLNLSFVIADAIPTWFKAAGGTQTSVSSSMAGTWQGTVSNGGNFYCNAGDHRYSLRR
jgi:hypothetical protein